MVERGDREFWRGTNLGGEGIGLDWDGERE